MRKEFLAVFSGFPDHHFSPEITERLRAELTRRKSIVFITACPLAYEQNDDDCSGMYEMFAEQGLPFEKHCVIDKRTEPSLAKELVEHADCIFLMGGGVCAEQLDLIREKGCYEALLNCHAAILGVSAGSMNMAKDTVDFFESMEPMEGLGFTDYTVSCHHDPENQWRFEQTLRMSEDRVVYAMEDMSAFFIKEGKVDLVGKIYRVENRELRLLTKDGLGKNRSMPIHFMRLQPAPFALIRDGRKTIELRLYDEKRRKLQIGDGILFENTEAPEMLLVRVTGLSVFASFDALYQALPLEACGYPEAEIASASPADMEAYYSKEEQRRYGVVGIELAPEYFLINKAGKQEAAAVAALAAKLWEHPAEELAEEFSALLAREDAALFLARQKDAVVGFAQCQLRRDYVEGTSSSPVGYLEGIYVDEAHRRRGLAAVLLHACEAWAKQQGCTEFASDCELENADSLRFHLSLGFREANRIICFTKEL